MTEALGRLVTTLDVIGLEAFVPEPPRGAGRPPDDRRALARAFVAKAVLGVPTTTALIERLDVDKSLRRILGWERRSQVPSEATFSRAFAEFAQGDLPDKMHAALIERSLGGRIVGVIARDATEIEAREKPVKTEPNDKKEDPPPPDGAQPTRKRGRPRKDEERPKPEPTRLERQTTQNLDQMLADLPTACDVGSKKNSKGYKETWVGYKLHLDVACGQAAVRWVSPAGCRAACPAPRSCVSSVLDRRFLPRGNPTTSRSDAARADQRSGALPTSKARHAECSRRKRPQTTHRRDVPDSVTITRERHAFEGQSLVAISSIRRRGVLLVLVALPDGSRSFIPAEWTDWSLEADRMPADDGGDGDHDLGKLGDLLHLRKVIDALSGRHGELAPPAH